MAPCCFHFVVSVSFPCKLRTWRGPKCENRETLITEKENGPTCLKMMHEQIYVRRQARVHTSKQPNNQSILHCIKRSINKYVRTYVRTYVHHSSYKLFDKIRRSVLKCDKHNGLLIPGDNESSTYGRAYLVEPPSILKGLHQEPALEISCSSPSRSRRFVRNRASAQDCLTGSSWSKSASCGISYLIR